MWPSWASCKMMNISMARDLVQEDLALTESEKRIHGALEWCVTLHARHGSYTRVVLGKISFPSLGCPTRSYERFIGDEGNNGQLKIWMLLLQYRHPYCLFVTAR